LAVIICTNSARQNKTGREKNKKYTRIKGILLINNDYGTLIRLLEQSNMRNQGLQYYFEFNEQ
jgi:hypothetical protein